MENVSSPSDDEVMIIDDDSEDETDRGTIFEESSFARTLRVNKEFQLIL